jgi:hypothetical protein
MNTYLSTNIPLPTLRATYILFDTPVDAIATDPQVLERFTFALNEATSQSLSTTEVIRLLLHARKRGLLPRLRRQYRGRQATKEPQHD